MSDRCVPALPGQPDGKSAWMSWHGGGAAQPAASTVWGKSGDRQRSGFSASGLLQADGEIVFCCVWYFSMYAYLLASWLPNFFKIHCDSSRNACSLLNTLQPNSQHSIGRQVRTAHVQHVPTLSAFVFSHQTPNKDHNEQLSPRLCHLTVLYKC